MKIVECVQYSPEWWSARRGIPTASNFSRILTPKTLKPSTSATGYIAELVADMVSQNPPFFTERQGHTEAMRNGANMEPEARRFFTLETGYTVRQVGFITTDDGRFGASPDGLVIGDGGEVVGGLELKCPEPKTQAEYLMDGGLPGEYRPQVQGGLLVSDLPRWWFMSYALPLRPLLIVVEPDEYGKALRAALDEFDGRYRAALDMILDQKGVSSACADPPVR